MQTPDFDSYPIDHQLRHVEPDELGVCAVWDDGVVTRHHALWLRENSPDDVTTHPVTREQALQLVAIPAELKVAAAAIDAGGGLEVTWTDGAAPSRFHPGWLRAYSTADGEGPLSLPPRRIWDARSLKEPPRFDGADEAGFGAWLEAIHVYGVAILENLPPDPGTIEAIPSRIGPIRESNFGKVFEVRSRADADSNAYTAMALPSHTDLATREYVPGLQFLFCLQNGASGGDSLLADGFALAERLRREHPEHFETLATVSLVYANKAVSTDYRWEKPMFALDAEGALDEVRWSPWLRAPLRAPVETVDRVYRALRSAFELGDDPAMQVRVRLQPGEMLGFDNRRALHGRTGFDPATGERWLRGCYVERDELYSRLRIMARERRAAALARAGS